MCASESFILTLGKEEIFGSWKLHLPSHQFITGIQYKVENKREDDLEHAGSEAAHYPPWKSDISFTLAKTQMFCSRPTRRVDPLVLCCASVRRIKPVLHLHAERDEARPSRRRQDLYAPALRSWKFTPRVAESEG